MQFSEQQTQMAKTIARQFPEFREMLAAWKQREMELMAQGSLENFGMSKGRVQLLTEMQQKFSL